jgi:hypothetical protein
METKPDDTAAHAVRRVGEAFTQGLIVLRKGGRAGGAPSRNMLNRLRLRGRSNAPSCCGSIWNGAHEREKSPANGSDLGYIGPASEFTDP